MLSDSQFADAVNTKGGASRNWRTGEPPPAQGYMVAEPNAEAVHAGSLTPAQVAAHHAEHDSGGLQGEVYQGGWADQDPQTGKPATFLDVSRRYDKPWGQVRDIAEAKSQIGVYHLPTSETHYTHRQMPGPQADPDWVSSSDRPSNYERDSSAVPELASSQGTYRGQPHTLEDVLRTIARNRMSPP